jgi:hypothetical protein
MPDITRGRGAELAIPEFSTDGLLPDGMVECTPEEVFDRFGRFQSSDRRPRLTGQLKEYIEELRAAQVAKYLVIDGSYVTQEPAPNDIDLLLVLRDTVDLSEPVPPFRYNARSRRYVRKKYNFDIFVGFESDDSASEILAFFRGVKYRPGVSKGLLKVVL